jgi:hypothetical protein
MISDAFTIGALALIVSTALLIWFLPDIRRVWLRRECKRHGGCLWEPQFTRLTPEVRNLTGHRCAHCGTQLGATP